MDDDYYEDKAREECLAKGLKPGDPIGEVGDITFGDRSNDPDRNKNNQAAPTNERASTIYKPGGPTTFFGGAGTGPFAGEMPSSRRAALSRDGVTEINWMAIAAASAIEANQQYTKLRKERVENSRGGTAGSASGTLVGGGTPAIQALEPFLKGSAVSEVIPPTNVAKEQFISQSVDTVPILTSGLSQAALRALNIKRPGFDENGSPVKRKRVKLEMDNTTKGVYEPHTGLTICEYHLKGLITSLTLPNDMQIVRIRNRHEVIWNAYMGTNHQKEESLAGPTLVRMHGLFCMRMYISNIET